MANLKRRVEGRIEAKIAGTAESMHIKQKHAVQTRSAFFAQRMKLSHGQQRLTLWARGNACAFGGHWTQQNKQKYDSDDMKVLQGNMNGTILANTLLDQWIAEEAPDVILSREPYQQRNDRTRILNADRKAVVWIPSDKLITRYERGQDYAWETVSYITFVSVYLPPNLKVGDFDTRLAELKDTLRDIHEDLAMGVDINARSPE